MNRRARCRAALAPVAVACAVSLPCLAGFPNHLPMERIGPEQGLPSATVTTVYRDRAGFVWIGTREGLAWYDGHAIRVFEHVVSDPTSLADNSIRTVYEDREGRLWIGTNAGGLDRLDRATWRFEHHRHDPGNGRSLSHDSVYAILQDRSGQLWVATQKGLNRFDPSAGTFEKFLSDPDDPSTLPNDYVNSLLESADGSIWIATVGGGIGRLDPASGRVHRLVPDPSDPLAGDAQFAFALAEGADGRIWVGNQAGLYLADPSAGMIRSSGIALPPTDPDRPVSVTSLAFDETGILWAATWRDGLLAVDLAEDRARAFVHAPATPHTLGDNRIPNMFRDAAGAFWVATWGGGVNYFRPWGDLFETLEVRDVTALLEDRKGRLWVGDMQEGLHILPPGAARFDFVDRPTEGRERLLRIVLSIAEAPDGAVWAGGIGGLFRIDEGRRTVRGVPQQPDEGGGLGAGRVIAVLVDPDGSVWAGLGGGGLYRIPGDGSSFQHFANDASNPYSLSEDYVTALLRDRRGAVWVGTRSGGLNELDPGTGRMSRFGPAPSDPGSLSHHFVQSILEDRRGDLWIGTAGGGLNRFHPGDRSFAHWTEKDGLVDDNIVAVLEDDDGTLWIATRRGLSRHDPESGAFANYGIGDGLPGIEFNPAAAVGREFLHFGTTGGVLSVRRGTPFDPGSAAPTCITSIRTLEGPLDLSAPAWETDAFRIPYGTPLSFEFAVPDFGGGSRYTYRLTGVSDEWVDVGSRRELTFASLDPGTFVLTVRGQNRQGVWSESRPLSIGVVPPFWMSWWFRALVLLGVAALAWSAHRVRLASLERRTHELGELQRAREDAREEERGWIARELHDELGQALSTMKLNVKLLTRAPTAEAREGRIEDTLNLLDDTIRHVRALSFDLRPPLLDELGLVPAVRGYAEGQAQRTGLDIRVEAGEVPRQIPADTALAAFRIVQEAIHNAFRHSGARRITVSLRHDPGWLRIVVRDDGSGFDMDEALRRAAGGAHLGLVGMRERAQALRGTLEVETARGSGTEVRATVPLEI